MASDEEVDERCLPACTRRSEEGGDGVRRERRVVRVEMVVEGGMVRGIVESPETVLMKICMVSSFSELDEAVLEMLSERCMMDV